MIYGTLPPGYEIFPPPAIPAINVLNYGAKGDGVHDDTAAIQATIDAAEVAGGNVYFPIGIYLVSAPLYVKRDRVQLEGDGWYSIITATAALGNNYLFIVENTLAPTSMSQWISFRNLAITLTHNNSKGILFVRSLEPMVDRVLIAGNNDEINGTQTGIVMDGYGDQVGTWGGGLRLHNSHIGYLKYGVQLTWVTTACHLNDTWITGCTGGIQAGSEAIFIDANASGLGTEIIGCEIEGWEKGIHDDFGGNKIISNRFENVTTPIQMNGPYYTIMGNTYTVSCGPSVFTDYRGMRVDLDYPLNLYTDRDESDVTVAGTRMNMNGYAYPGGPKMEWWLRALAGVPLGVIELLSADAGHTMVNAFGETADTNEFNLASNGGIGLKIGTGVSIYGKLDFYTNGLRRGGFSNSGVFDIAAHNIQYGTAAPGTGTGTQGDVVWKSDATSGQPAGWMCTHSGTFSAATDNTGDTDGVTNVITGMADTSDFAIGDYVDVSAGFPATGPYRILSKTASSITITVNSNAAANNITVDTSDPVWTAMANLA